VPPSANKHPDGTGRAPRRKALQLADENLVSTPPLPTSTPLRSTPTGEFAAAPVYPALAWSEELPKRPGWWWRWEPRWSKPYRIRIEPFNAGGPLIGFTEGSFGFHLVANYSFGGWWYGPLVERPEAPPVETPDNDSAQSPDGTKATL
jgi:hypothetical protein